MQAVTWHQRSGLQRYVTDASDLAVPEGAGRDAKISNGPSLTHTRPPLTGSTRFTLELST